MPPIRKGDGTPVAPKGISQVRTGDGRILFDGVAIPDSVASRPEDDDSTTGPTRLLGLVINPNADFDEFAARISGNTSSASRARVYDYGSSAYIETVDISGKSAGDTVIFPVSISAGQDYGIELDNNGSDLTYGFANGATDYPYNGNDIDIVGQSDAGTKETDENAISFNDIGNPDNVL